jgi:hypothetical protein
MSLDTWLDEHGLGAYRTVLEQNGIGLDVVQDLSEDDLKELGFLAR